MNRQLLEKILLVIFIIALPWQTRWIINSGNLANAYWEYGTMSMYAIDIFVFVFAVFLLCSKKHISRQTLYLLIAILGLFSINLYKSLSLTLSLFHIVWIIEAIIVALYIKHSKLSSEQLALSFASSAALAGFVGMWQFISQSAKAFKWLGLATHDPAALGTSVIEAVAPDGVVERWLRAYGPLDHPNMLGGLLALGIIVLFWLMIAKAKNTSTLYRSISLFIMIGLSGGLIASFSRSGWLALIIGLLTLGFFLRNKIKDAWQHSWPLLGVGIIMLGLFVGQYYYLFTPRFSVDTRLENTSITERVSGYKDSLILIPKHPIIGSGLGTYGLALHTINSKQLVWFYQPVHNSFLLLSTELGVAGLLLLLAAVYIYIKSITTSQRALAFSLLLALTTIALFDHWPLSLHAGILSIATLIGISLKAD